MAWSAGSVYHMLFNTLAISVHFDGETTQKMAIW